MEEDTFNMVSLVLGESFVMDMAFIRMFSLMSTGLKQTWKQIESVYLIFYNIIIFTDSFLKT
jgi:hypothetical protein